MTIFCSSLVFLNGKSKKGEYHKTDSPSYLSAMCDDVNTVVLHLALPEPVAFYPLNSRYSAAEIHDRQPEGILGDVAVTKGPYDKPGGAYMFFGTLTSYIEFPNSMGLDTRLSITLMCWVQPGGQDGPLFSYGGGYDNGVLIGIDGYKFFNVIADRDDAFFKIKTSTAKVLTLGVWAHVAATYNSGTGNISLYINGHLSISNYIPIADAIFTGYQISTKGDPVRMGVAGIKDPYFKGKIAEMKVYDDVLNEAEIQAAIRQGNYKNGTPKTVDHCPSHPLNL